VRVILDTNVVISALIWGGKPYELIKLAVAGDLILFTSPMLKSELHNVLMRSHFLRKLEMQKSSIAEIVSLYDELTISILPTSVPRVVPHDRDDDEVIAAAVTARAQLIITGDSDLLSLAQHNEIKIVTVAQALGLMER
jgi:uncharacterized protein